MSVSVMQYPVPANELARLKALSRLSIVGSAREAAFDSVVSLACGTFNVPIALVSLLDEQQQWFKACRGLDVCSTERESAFCNYPVASGNMVVVEDARLDPRFSHNRLVTAAPFIRFYAGTPISIDPGVHLGSLCIIDTKPRQLSLSETHQLREMADIVKALLRQYRDARALTRVTRELEERTLTISAQADELTRQKSLFDRASALTKSGAWEWRLADDQLHWTQGMYDIHDLPRGSPITPEQVHAFYPQVAHDELEGLMSKSMRQKRGYKFEGPMTTAKGTKRWVRLVANVECEKGQVIRRYGIKQDITEQKIVWDRMKFLAECDPLTRLANRTTFYALIEQMHKHSKPRHPLALLIMDVDGFKHLNDTFGHLVGDECLKQIARRLKRVCPEAVLIARMGGDEFGLLLNAPDGDLIGAQAKRILASLRRPVSWRGQSFQLSASMGIAHSDLTSSKQALELFTEADLALYAAKNAGRNTFRSYVPDMKIKANERFESIRCITMALKLKELELFYQPKIDLGAGDTLAGFEALLRWRRPDGQMIAAGMFAAAFEDPELSDLIGKWVIGEALRQARTWHEGGIKFGHIAINLSSGQFREPNFANRLIQDIDRHGLSPDMIEVEVTESVFLDHGAGEVKRILLALRDAGIRIALDDFGTGYASLSHLRTFPVDIIKVDRSFVKDFLTSKQDHAILQSTLFLARHLNLDVVAEGIEEPDQCAFLRALGCRYGQGYLFSKAVCASEAAEWCLPRPKTVRDVA